MNYHFDNACFLFLMKDGESVFKCAEGGYKGLSALYILEVVLKKGAGGGACAAPPS